MPGREVDGDNNNVLELASLTNEQALHFLAPAAGMPVAIDEGGWSVTHYELLAAPNNLNLIVASNYEEEPESGSNVNLNNFFR